MDEQIAGDLDRMLRAAETALAYVGKKSRDEFRTDQKTQDAVALQLIIIGGAANRLRTRAPEFVSLQTSVPWLEIRGMRNRIAHDYHRVDQRVVWDTVQQDLPDLIRSLRALMQRIDQPPHSGS